MNTETLDRLEAALQAKRTEQDLAIYGRLAPAELINALPALLSIARRAADVEGICRIAHDTFENDDDSGGGAYMRLGKAVSRYVMGETTPLPSADIGCRASGNY